MKKLNEFSPDHTANPFWHPEGAYISDDVYKDRTIWKAGLQPLSLKKFMMFMVTAETPGIKRWLNQIEELLAHKMSFEDWKDLELKKQICEEIIKRRVLRKMALSASREAVIKLDQYHHEHPLIDSIKK